MAKPIRWTQEALRTYVAIIRYLEAHWTVRENERFNVELDNVLIIVSKYPRGARRVGSSYIREVLIGSTNLLIYRIRDDQVELLSFWDTRRDPRKKPGYRSRRSNYGK